MKNLFARFVKDESGVTAIEYGLIAALVGVAIITGATLLGGTLNDTFQYVADTMSDAAPTGGGDGGDPPPAP
jgi:pilus assembly protein Flp/PilA